MFTKNPPMMLLAAALLALGGQALAAAPNARFEPAPGLSAVQVHGTSTIHDWTVQSRELKGALELPAAWADTLGVGAALPDEPDEPARHAPATQPSEPATPRIVLRIPAASLSSDNRGMDNKTHEALRAKDHPELEYTLARVVEVKAGEEHVTWRTRGHLTVAGQRREVALELRLERREAGLLAIRTQTGLKMSDFGIKPPTAMLGTIRAGDSVRIEATWVLRPAAREGEARGAGRASAAPRAGAALGQPLLAGAAAITQATLAAPAEPPPAVGELALHGDSAVRLAGRATIGAWRSVGSDVEGTLATGIELPRLLEAIDRLEAALRHGAEPPALADQIEAAHPPAASIRLPARSLRGESPGMERDLHAALKARRHPTIAYTLQRVEGVSATLDPRGELVVCLATRGELLLAGVREPIDMEVQVRRLGPQRFSLLGAKVLRMSDFDITPPTALLGLIRAHEQVEVTFDLVVQPLAEPEAEGRTPLAASHARLE